MKLKILLILVIIDLNYSIYGAPSAAAEMTEPEGTAGDHQKIHHPIKRSKINHSFSHESRAETSDEQLREDNDEIKTYQKRQLATEKKANDELLAQLVDSLKTVKAKENEPTFDEIEEIFACTDKNNEKACSLNSNRMI